MYAIHFEVLGRGGFPYDMLRHDRCFPSDTGSAQSMEVEPDVRYSNVDRTIKLTAYTTNKNWKPTTERWNSFQWGVFKVEEARKA
jgi:hypothetical protein